MAAGGERFDPRAIRDELPCDVYLPDDDDFDRQRQVWNLAVVQRPIAVVVPRSADEVVATVAFAAEHGLRIAFNGGGHNAGTIDWADDTLLLRTERLTGISVDVAARTARVEAGVLAKALAEAVRGHGLTYLSGTSPDVGIVGYVIGGGYSWMVRRYGLAANSILAVELVTADGRLRRVDADHDPDLFWAVRGGGGNLGAVTAVELSLYPIPQVYAGRMLWPIERARETLTAWRTWVEDVPDTCESIGRMLQLPDEEFLPDELRGRSFVLVELAFIGNERDGATLVRPLRDLGPEFDTVEMMSTSDLSEVNMDPEAPVPYVGDGILLDDLTSETVDAMVDAFVGSPLLHVEARHLGGALRSSSPEHGCLDTIEQGFLLFTFGLAADADMAGSVGDAVGRLISGLAPWDSGRRYLNFVESPIDPRSMFSPEAYERLREIRTRYDSQGMFVANHSIPLLD